MSLTRSGHTNKELEELRAAEKNCVKHLLDIWPGRSPVQPDHVLPCAGGEWLPPTFAYPWGMVFDLEAVPAVLSNLSELTLYCPVMAMPSELEDNPMRYCGLSLDSLQDPLMHPMLPPHAIATQPKLFEKGALCQRIHAGFLC